MEVLAVIPARGGSTGIPRKNVMPLAGKPLFAHSIEHAQGAASVCRTIVSTDDEEIARLAVTWGAEVPFMRPDELGGNEVLDLAVFEHALAWLAKHEGYRPDLVVHLRPTGPLRWSSQIDEAVDLLHKTPEADSVRSVSVPSQHPYRMFSIGEEGFLHPLLQTEYKEPFLLRRQDCPPVYWYNCVLDVTRSTTITEKHSMTGDRILPYVMEAKFVVDIDMPDDLLLAEAKVRQFREVEGPSI